MHQLCGPRSKIVEGKSPLDLLKPRLGKCIWKVTFFNVLIQNRFCNMKKRLFCAAYNRELATTLSPQFNEDGEVIAIIGTVFVKKRRNSRKLGKP